MNIETLTDSEALANRSCQFIEEAARYSIADHESFVWAVSGGSTPKRFLEKLAYSEEIDWSKVHLFQVDERIAPDGDPLRNATMIEQALFSTADLSAKDLAGYYLMPVTKPDLETSANQYAEKINEITNTKASFDLIQLGLGDDGHTASLIPGDPILKVEDKDVGLTGEYRGSCRMTLTKPILNKAKALLWVVSGESKADAYKKFVNKNLSIPASMLDQNISTVLIDESASND